MTYNVFGGTLNLTLLVQQVYIFNFHKPVTFVT